MWRATRVDRAQNAILKIVKPTAFSMGSAFENLAQTLTQYGRLAHPNLASVIASARRSEDGLFGLATEYFEGRNLDVYPFRAHGAQSIVDTPAAFGAVLGVIEQLGNTLMWLHTAGAMHGNVKPSNVLVLPGDGKLQVKLVDFIWSRAGLSRYSEYQQTFKPPELLQGRAASPRDGPVGRSKSFASTGG